MSFKDALDQALWEYDESGELVWPEAAPPTTQVTADQMAAFTLASQQARFALMAFNPHQRRGPDGRWIKMPTGELKRPRARKAPRPKVELPRADSMEAPTPAPRAPRAVTPEPDSFNTPNPMSVDDVPPALNPQQQWRADRNAHNRAVLDRAEHWIEEGEADGNPDDHLENLARKLREDIEDQDFEGAGFKADDVAMWLANEYDDEEIPVAPMRPQTPGLGDSFRPGGLAPEDEAYRQLRNEYNGLVYALGDYIKQSRQGPEHARLADAVWRLEQELADDPTYADEAADDLKQMIEEQYPEFAAMLPPAPRQMMTIGGGGPGRPDRPPVTAPYAERAAALAQSRGSGITAETSLSGGVMGDTRMLTLGDGTRAVYKKALRAWNSPEGVWSTKEQTDAEELSALLAAELGVRAPAIDRISDTELLMEVMPGKPANALGLSANERDDLRGGDEGMKLGLLDVLLDNNDRHLGNWMVDSDRNVYAIDHGLAFFRNPPPGQTSASSSQFARAYFVETDGRLMRENELTKSDISYVEDAIERVRPRFEELGHGDWATQALARLYMLGSRARGSDPLYK